MTACPRSPDGDCRPAGMAIEIAHLRAKLADATADRDIYRGTLMASKALLGAAEAEYNALRADVARLRGNADALRDRAERVERERDVALGEVAGQRRRLRDTARIIIDAIGAVGPEDAEDAARRAVAEVARLRAVIAEASADLPVHPEGAYLTPPEADAEDVRQALIAALGGDR